MKSISQNPAYIAATAQLNELLEARVAAVFQESELLAQLAAPVAAPSALSRAVALLKGDVTVNRQDMAGLQTRLGDVRSSLALLNDAITEQRAAMAALVRDASVAANDQTRPAHLEAVEHIKNALDGLRQALRAEAALRNDVTNAGFRCSLEAMVRPELNFADPQSMVSRFDKEVSDFITHAETQDKKAVSVHLLVDCNAGAVGDVVALPGTAAAELVRRGHAEVTTDKQRTAPKKAQFVESILM